MDKYRVNVDRKNAPKDSIVDVQHVGGVKNGSSKTVMLTEEQVESLKGTTGVSVTKTSSEKKEGASDGG